MLAVMRFSTAGKIKNILFLSILSQWFRKGYPENTHVDSEHLLKFVSEETMVGAQRQRIC